MSFYSDIHGDSAAVDLVVQNDYDSYMALMVIVDNVDTHNLGREIDRAAAEYRRMVSSLSRYKHRDLRGVRLNRVDFHTAIRTEIQERQYSK